MDFRKFAFLAVVACLVFACGSCTSVKKMQYLNTQLSDTISQVNFVHRHSTYLLQTGDHIYIDIRTLDPALTQLFNLKSDNRSDPYNDNSMYLNSYVISDSGYINLPVCGELRIAGLDITRASSQVQDSISRYFTQSYVSLKLVNAEITVLGEVKHPGTMKVNDTEINLLKALSLAGDMTEYGERRKVQIIRERGDQTYIEVVDLTQPTTLGSGAYYLHPGDAVYVPPISLRPLETNLGPVRTIVQFIATGLIAFRLFN